MLGFTSKNDKVLLIQGQAVLAELTEAESRKLLAQLKAAVASAAVGREARKG